MRPGPGGLDVIRTHALTRLAVGADIPSLQVSWVKEGLRMAEHLLTCGANDLGGTLMNESISTAAGARHGQVATPAALRRVAEGAGRVAAERTTLYRVVRIATPGAHERRDPLDGVADPTARFGTYAALTRDPRFRFHRRRRGEQLVEIDGPVEVEGQAGGVDDGHAQARGGGGGEVAGEAVGMTEAGGERCGQADGQRVGPELVAIRRKHQLGLG